MDTLGPEAWNGLVERADVPTAFGRYEWVDSWWKTHGPPRHIRIYCAHAGDRLVGLIPTVWPAGPTKIVHLAGEPHADYACVLTDKTFPNVFPRLIDAICADVPNNGRLRLSELRSDSPYPEALSSVDNQQIAHWVKAATTVCPRTRLDLRTLSEILKKKSLRRHARGLSRLGAVQVNHHRAAEAILSRLDAFFDQHVLRWADTPFPSLFCDEENRKFYRQLAHQLSGTGVLVFSEVCLDGHSVASHLGFISEGDLIWYKPTFDPAYSRHSPGEVLIYELFKFAGELGLKGFDFTRGDEPFKYRFANEIRETTTFVFYGSSLTARRIRLVQRLKTWLKKTLPRAAQDVLRHLRGSLDR